MTWWLIHRKGALADEIAELDAPKMLSSGGDIEYRSTGYATREALIEDQRIIDLPCRECGGPIKTAYMKPIGEQLAQRQLCFHCDHWTRIIETLHAPERVIVNGRSYWIGNEEPKDYRGFLGFGGAKFKIRFNDGREVVTHNLWTQGEVPDHFRARLPDNAVFEERS